MNYLAKFATLAILAGLVVGTTSMTSPVAADKSNAHVPSYRQVGDSELMIDAASLGSENALSSESPSI
jgi:hypothetical protein